jgi:diketogulonate reductase-like aldo/keto reductase
MDLLPSETSDLEDMMQRIMMPNNVSVPALGQGTWNMGDDPTRRAAEIGALQRGVELGMTVIDTAEMYGNGASERLVGEALVSQTNRSDLFIVSKALPDNATPAALQRACQASLQRLETDYLDLYLLHWRGSVPLKETVRGMQLLQSQGMIRQWGVSNFDVNDLADLASAGGAECAANQVLYNLNRRGPEFSLLPTMAVAGIACMAYSPVEQGRLIQTGAIARVALGHGVTPMQVALAWIMRPVTGMPGMIAIPKAAEIQHVEQNRAAADLCLTPEDLCALDGQFAPPSRKRPLEMI